LQTPAPTALVENALQRPEVQGPSTTDLPQTPALSAASLALGAPRGLQAGSLPSATLPHPPGHSAFAAELGAQVAVWVRDGLHQAQLNLNPAELGPVQVRIHMDGQQAQVQFVADHALTREALQMSMGELTQALKQEGLSLGRSDVQSGHSNARDGAGQAQTGNNSSDSDGQRARRSGWGREEGPPNPSGRPGERTARGLLDLYA
jgi:flagellar hook-length control protein FliK